MCSSPLEPSARQGLRRYARLTETFDKFEAMSAAQRLRNLGKAGEHALLGPRFDIQRHVRTNHEDY
jgi:hypothetical protein